MEVFQTYASGPASQVNSIIWPNPEFDNNITVYGPEVKALVERYLDQMMGELGELPHPDGPARCSTRIDLVVPHQANRTMVTELAARPASRRTRSTSTSSRVGNVSAASIPLAHPRRGRATGAIDRPMRVFAPGFGAGAVAGYAVLRVDPAVMVPETAPGSEPAVRADRSSSSEDVRAAFG